jgi:hypothetical protein
MDRWQAVPMIARITMGVAILGLCAPAWPEAPYIDPADDEKYFGPPEAELFWTLEQKVSGYRNMDKISWTRAVPAGGDVFPLPTELQDLGTIEIKTDDVSMTVDEYVRKQNVAGLIVVKNGTVVYERYELGNTRESRAIRDGYIKSVDERVTDYLPRLRNSAYAESSIRNVLQMASGVEWTEVYDDPQSDINRVTWPTLELYEYLRNKPRAAALSRWQ